ncbi:3-hydroxyacyl-CoA dehydrogenase family protein [Lachnospiraceae bacterium ZAX-1]
MKIENVVIIGAGMMGRGIAQVLSSCKDLQITLYDFNNGGVLEGIKELFTQLQERGILTSEEVAGRLERISFTTNFDDDCFASADFVVECVFEDMEIKQNLFAQLEGKCRRDTIFATNTSVMSPTEISAKIKYKERLVGTHFWNPAYLIPLVEVVKSDYTDVKVVEATIQLLTECGKKPIYCKKDVPGFVANRLQHALWREAFYMVQEGIADPKTVDDACKYGPGLRWPVLGPMENSDMVGIQLTYNIHDYILEHLADNHRPSPLLKEMLDRGDQGFKSGKGWQEWTKEQADASTAGLREYLIDHMANAAKE